MSLAFGIHLVRTGVVSAEQLIDVIEEQLNTRPQLGQLALQEGLLTMSQVFEILGVQTSEEKPFGAIAQERGYLTTAQLALLLMKQRRMELGITDLLVDRKVITSDQVTRLSAEWKLQNRRSETFAAGRIGMSHANATASLAEVAR